VNAQTAGEERACPICAEPGCKPLAQYSREPWRVVECAACGFVYLHNAPDYADLVDHYAWEKTYQEEKRRRRRAMPVLMAIDRATRWRLDLFRQDLGRLYRRIFRPGRVLDVGCGPGDFVPEPFTPFGIELSEVLHRQADAHMRSRGGYAVHASASEGMAAFPAGHFSGVILASIIEHEKNPRRLLSEARRVLADDGAVYLKVPNFGGANRRLMGGRWCGFRHPDHVNYFTAGALRRLAAETGLKLRHLNPLSVFDDNIHAILTKSA